ncbi:MAG: hypothetical protein HY849_03000 [Nitrosomonadales bacterium]|nr:hypothetical protein [Nitrosomonadales bacterium]
MAKFTFLDLAETVLKQAGNPLTSDEIWEFAKKSSLHTQLTSQGQTPWATIGARLYMDSKESKSKFERVGKRPVRFWLKGVTAVCNTMPMVRDTSPSKMGFKERQLHPFLTYFANTYFRGVLCKTIFHEGSSKKSFSEWLHPDMVGFYLPINDWELESIELAKRSGANILTLYSFELKRELNFSNLREAFFQAVSNSSWANEGYLVAANINRDDEFRSELERLSASFGIGVIALEVDDPDSSGVIFPAKHKTELDWDSINKLSAINPDFRKFLADVGAALQTSRVYEREFDEVFKDPEELKKTLA